MYKLKKNIYLLSHVAFSLNKLKISYFIVNAEKKILKLVGCPLPPSVYSPEKQILLCYKNIFQNDN